MVDGMAAYKKNIGSEEYKNQYDKIDWSAKPKKKVERVIDNEILRIEKIILKNIK